MNQYLLDELECKILDTVSSYIEEHKLQNYSILLSGGFDSGLLAAITEPKQAFRIKFPYGTLFDETRYAKVISKHLNIKLNEYTITPEIFKQNFEEAVKVYGEVTTHFSLVPLYILFKNISETGVTDILSGEGPDEYLGGYARQIIFDELRKLYKIPELRNYKSLLDREVGGKFVQWYGAMEGFNYDFEKVCEYQKLYDEGKYPLQGVIGKMDMELGHIEKMEQKFANHFGIKLHYPYINEEFAEYCYRLPDDMKIKNGRTKVAFKEIAMKYLPEIMRNRVKMGGPVAPVNKLMGWNLDDFDKSKYIEEQKRILGL